MKFMFYYLLIWLKVFEIHHKKIIFTLVFVYLYQNHVYWVYVLFRLSLKTFSMYMYMYSYINKLIDNCVLYTALQNLYPKPYIYRINPHHGQQQGL